MLLAWTSPILFLVKLKEKNGWSLHIPSPLFLTSFPGHVHNDLGVTYKTIVALYFVEFTHSFFCNFWPLNCSKFIIKDLRRITFISFGLNTTVGMSVQDWFSYIDSLIVRGYWLAS